MARQGASDLIQQRPEAIKEVSIDELCAICHITPNFIVELVAYGTIEPQGSSTDSWRFDPRQLQVIRTAVRLHHDLEVNHAGIAVALDLLDQIENLQAQLDTFKKYFNHE
jgi:chaperone modulatory protein CbpM